MLDERKTYTLVAEPTGEVYRRLLVCSLASCDMGLLVIRSGADLHAQAARVLQQLEPFLVSCREESSWPGMTLVGHTATVRRFRWCPETQDVLARTVEGLYRWREPRLPEDPCLFRPDGSVWLATIAHEHDGWFELSEDEKAALVQDVPGLALVDDALGRGAPVLVRKRREQTQRILAVVQSRAPALASELMLVQDVSELPLSVRRQIVDVLTDELCEHGLAHDHEPNEHGLEVEELIDVCRLWKGD